jgi:dTDP-4-dehydrorhamnose reductase
MRVLVTGAGGMLGQGVGAAAAAAGLSAVSLPRAALDVTDRDALDSAVAETRPDVVVNCAGWTDVDGGERDPGGAHAVNADGAGHVARAAFDAGAWTIHVSTDYVFDGTKREPYVESDPVGPLSVYGRSKLDGELAVAEAAPGRHTIVRSSWLFGTGGPCFPATIMRLAAERPALSVVDDQVGCPTFTGHLAAALVELGTARVPGIVHVAASGSCSWFQFARAIVDLAGLGCEVTPCATAEFPRPAARPAYSVLGTERGGQAPVLPHWRDGLAQFMALTVAA